MLDFRNNDVRDIILQSLPDLKDYHRWIVVSNINPQLENIYWFCYCVRHDGDYFPLFPVPNLPPIPSGLGKKVILKRFQIFFDDLIPSTIWIGKCEECKSIYASTV